MRERPANRQAFVKALWLARNEVPSFDRFPFNIPAIENLRSLDLHPAVTFFIGENGSGKSTLLEAIAIRLNMAETGGEDSASFQHHAPDGGLHDYLRLEEHLYRRTSERFFMRAETVFDMANELERGHASKMDRYGIQSLHQRSHGEAFLAIVQNRLRSESFFILDEPEAALSPARQLVLIKEIDWLVRSGCQFVIATHSPILMAYPDSIVYQLGEDGIEQVDWKDTEHYRITLDFLKHPDAFLRHLIE